MRRAGGPPWRKGIGRNPWARISRARRRWPRRPVRISAVSPTKSRKHRARRAMPAGVAWYLDPARRRTRTRAADRGHGLGTMPQETVRAQLRPHRIELSGGHRPTGLPREWAGSRRSVLRRALDATHPLHPAQGPHPGARPACHVLYYGFRCVRLRTGRSHDCPSTSATLSSGGIQGSRRFVQICRFGRPSSRRWFSAPTRSV